MTQPERNLIGFIRTKLLARRFSDIDRQDVLDALDLLLEIRRAA